MTARWRIARDWALAVGFAALLFYLSSQSRLPSAGIRGFDKLAHFAAFGVLAWLVARALSRSGVGRTKAALLAALISTLYGGSDELHQRHTPGRSSDWADLAADGLGASAASALWAQTRRRRPDRS